MDIEYLLFLQNFRNSIHDAWTPFMEWVSSFATTYLILLPVYWYWNQDKKRGLYTLASYYLAILITPLIKLTACVYRPWIRDARVLPAGDSIRTATGYSFPSGHTVTGTTLGGGMAVDTWEKKQTRWLSAVLAVFVLLTGFSRNYLGVHTPQDVAVGFLLSVLCLVIMSKLFRYLDAHPETEDRILIGCFLFCILAIFYITFKSYPMDPDAEGRLIVDPQKMMNDGYGDIGKTMGFLAGRFTEKHWVKFRSPGKTPAGIAVCAAGLVLMVLLKKYLSPVMTGYFGSHWGKLFFSVIYAFYYMALFPVLFRFIGKREEKPAEGSGNAEA